jgi:hypothetical protein
MHILQIGKERIVYRNDVYFACVYQARKHRRLILNKLDLNSRYCVLRFSRGSSR